MPEIALVFGVGVLVGGLILHLYGGRSSARRAGTSSTGKPVEAGHESVAAVGSLASATPDPIASALSRGAEIFIPTNRQDEYLVIGAGGSSPEGTAVPVDVLSSVTAGVSTSLQGAVEALKASGRLVLVDQQTAQALNAGRMVKDSSGQVAAVVRGAGGRFEHVARLTPSAGRVAGTAMATANVLGAVSTQMQMASIEAKLKSIVSSTKRLEELADRELAASINATRRLVEEVYEPSRGADSLPQESWAQLAPHFHTVLRDQKMAVGNVEDLVRRALEDPDGFWLGKRQAGLSDVRRHIEEKLALLRTADLNVVRLNLIRLWHYTAHNPELAPHFAQLAREELESQEARERALVDSLQANLADHGELGRIDRTVHWRRAGDYQEAVAALADIEALPRLALGELPAVPPPS